MSRVGPQCWLLVGSGARGRGGRFGKKRGAMILRRLLCLSLLGCLPAVAEPLLPVPLPGRIVQQVGLPSASGYFLPQSPYLLVFGEYDSISESTILWVFRREKGRYRLWHEGLVEGEWGDSGLDCFPLEPGSKSKVALGNSGNTFKALLFTRGLQQMPEYLSLYAGDEATPWAIPGYQFNLRRRRLIIESCFDTPEGSSRGAPEFEWNGKGWRRLR